MPIKIVHIIMRWDNSIGGVKRFIFNAAKTLDPSIFRQAILPMGRRDASPTDARQSECITIYDPVIKKRGASATDLLFAGIKLQRRLKDMHPDAVHIHCNNGLGYLYAQSALNAGIGKRIVHSHNSSLGDDGFVKRVTHVMLCKQHEDAPTHKIACSQAAGQHLFRNAAYDIFHNAIDLDECRFDSSKRVEIRGGLGIGDDVITIGHVGSGIPVKNTEMVLRIALAVKGMGYRVKCLLIGDGGEIDNLKRCAHEIGLDEETLFLGTITNIFDYYNAMDAFLLPSFYEGLPISLIEAQGNGIPCLTSTHVTKEADATGTVDYLSIEDGAVNWATKIISNQDSTIHRRELISERNREALARSGYSLAGLGEQLTQLYMDAELTCANGGN